jgi:hypothetical protein
VPLGNNWRWINGRLGDNCGDCRESAAGHPATTDGATILCLRCSILTGRTMVASPAPRRVESRQLELAA